MYSTLYTPDPFTITNSETEQLELHTESHKQELTAAHTQPKMMRKICVYALRSIFFIFRVQMKRKLVLLRALRKNTIHSKDCYEQISAIPTD